MVRALEWRSKMAGALDLIQVNPGVGYAPDLPPNINLYVVNSIYFGVPSSIAGLEALQGDPVTLYGF